jgi:hypothetical protein
MLSNSAANPLGKFAGGLVARLTGIRWSNSTMLLTSIAAAVYLTGLVFAVIIGFNEYLTQEQIAMVSIGWPIVILYGIGYNVFK